MQMFGKIIDIVSKIVDWGVAWYNWVLENILGIKFMHTYIDSHKFIRYVSDQYLHLTDEEYMLACQTSPVDVVGAQRMASVATRRIRLHALRVLVVTALCAWPQSWIMWPLLVVDIVYFQLQVFAITQELYMLYKPSDQYSGDNQFNYASLANTAIRMAGTKVKHKIVKNAKKVVGNVVKQVMKRSSGIFRTSLQTFIRQVFKWCGITVTKDFVEMSLSFIVSGLCALIGGVISYWIFIPMARRLQRDLLAYSAGDVGTDDTQKSNLDVSAVGK